MPADAPMATASDVRMANDIAAQFRHLPEAEAVPAIANHFRTFWAPRMRAQLLAYVDHGGTGVDDRAAAAIRALR